MGAKVAYFSMEIAVDAGMPTYSGGLGILAGDTIRAAANLKVPMAAVSMLHRKGYFHQQLDDSGWQTERRPGGCPKTCLRNCPQGPRSPLKVALSD